MEEIRDKKNNAWELKMKTKIVAGELSYSELRQQNIILIKASKNLLNVLGIQGDELSESNIAYIKEWNGLKTAIDNYEKKMEEATQ